MKPVIYTEIPALDPVLAETVGRLAVADLHEGLGPVHGRLALMRPAMRPLVPGMRIFGQAVTCYAYPGDNLALHVALNLVKPGQVIVATNGGSSDGALWGELACTLATARGIAGVVVDGGVRDTDALREIGLPVFTTAISPSHPEKRGPASVNVPVVCAGVNVEPGDLIVGDGDGVLAIPRGLVRAALDGTQARVDKEIAMRKSLAEGKTLYELIGIERILAAAGIEQRTGTWLDDDRP